MKHINSIYFLSSCCAMLASSLLNEKVSLIELNLLLSGSCFAKKDIIV